MAKTIQQTEDSIVITYDDKIYTADMPTFEREAGGSFPKLPTGAEYRIYEPGVRHALVGGHGKFSESGEMPWPIGDNVLNNIDEFMRAQAVAQANAKIQEQADYDNHTRDMEIAVRAAEAKAEEERKAALEAYYKTKDGLKDYSANERWKKQQGGMVSGVFGKLNTDDKTYGMLTSLAVALDKGLVEPPVNYKGVDEWAELSAEQVIAIGKEVAGFIQKCFNAELSIAADIEDGKITSTEEIDEAYKAF